MSKLLTYKVQGPDRWSQNSTIIEQSLTKTKISCVICNKKVLIKESFRIWPSGEGAQFLWACSDLCSTTYILSKLGDHE